MTLKSARLTTFPIWCNLLSLLVKMHTTATACIVCHVATMKLRLAHSSPRETYFSPCLYPTSNLSLHFALEVCPSTMPRPNPTLEKGDDGAIPCTRVSALFSLGSSLLVKNQLKQNTDSLFQGSHCTILVLSISLTAAIAAVKQGPCPVSLPRDQNTTDG